MTECLIAMGGNQGDCMATFRRALKIMQAEQRVHVRAVSSAFHTPPIGFDQCSQEFLNAAMSVQTSLTPRELLNYLLDLERQLGRDRRIGLDRILDLDLLLYGNQVVSEAGDLIVPHPRMSFRRFVLLPAVQIAPDWLHPLCGLTLQQLLNHLDAAPNLVSLMPIGQAEAALVLKKLVANFANIRLVRAEDFTDDRNLDESGWNILPLSRHQSVPPRSKLLVWLTANHSTKWERFAGPMLNLGRASSDDLSVHLKRAIDAMSAFQIEKNPQTIV